MYRFRWILTQKEYDIWTSNFIQVHVIMGSMCKPSFVKIRGGDIFFCVDLTWNDPLAKFSVDVSDFVGHKLSRKACKGS